MIYLKIIWNHDENDEPFEIFLELDLERYELRKIEKFKNGTTGFSSQNVNVNCAQLSDLPVPSIEEINADAQFMASSIFADEFEEEWVRASCSKDG